jgi:hypothetical protein
MNIGKISNFFEYVLKSSVTNCIQIVTPPKFFATQKTFLNANIMFNSRVSSQKLGATDTALYGSLDTPSRT